MIDLPNWSMMKCDECHTIVTSPAARSGCPVCEKATLEAERDEAVGLLLSTALPEIAWFVGWLEGHDTRKEEPGRIPSNEYATKRGREALARIRAHLTRVQQTGTPSPQGEPEGQDGE